MPGALWRQRVWPKRWNGFPRRLSDYYELDQHRMRNSRVLLTSVFFLVGCGSDQQQTSSTSQTVDSVRTSASSTPRSVDSVGTQMSPVLPAPRTGPRLVIDSTIAEPRIDTLDTEFVVHLPISLAQALEDSFPKFSLFSRRNYDGSLVASIDRRESEKAPLTATAGDFDGNGRRDLAMLGRSSNAVFAFVILLSGDRPKLLVVEHQVAPEFDRLSDYISLVKPGTISGYGGRRKTDLHLATDGIRKEIVEHLTLLIYLDHGVAKQLQLSEPD